MKTKNVKMTFKEPNISEKTVRLLYKRPLPKSRKPKLKKGEVQNLFLLKSERIRKNFLRHVENNDIDKIDAMIKRGSVIKVSYNV